MQNHRLLISARDLRERAFDPGIRILDCRFSLLDTGAGRRAYEVGHIPGAVYADLESDLSGAITPTSGRHPLPDPSLLAATFGRFGIDSRTQVVVYDDAGGSVAARAWWLLRWLGHDDVAVLNGGIGAWRAEGGSLQDGSCNVASAAFTGSERRHLTIDTQEILEEVVRKHCMLLVDARDPQRFAGDRETLDAKAGHIPGAVNLPFAACIEPDGTWKSAEELRSLWGQALSGNPRGQPAVMCGSGVTACHLIVSAQLAGLPEPRLYAGSWSEWIRDPSRPLASGTGQPDKAAGDRSGRAEPA